MLSGLAALGQPVGDQSEIGHELKTACVALR